MLKFLSEHYISLPENEKPTVGFTMDSFCECLNWNLSAIEKDKYECILFENGFIQYLSKAVKLFQINEKGRSCYYKGGWWNDEVGNNEADLKLINLYGELIGKYMQNISAQDFVEVIKYKNLPNGISKISWIGDRVDCIRFALRLNFSIKQLNNCFNHTAGKFRANDKPKNQLTKTDIARMLSKYLG
jgi:hypothetical protein